MQAQPVSPRSPQQEDVQRNDAKLDDEESSSSEDSSNSNDDSEHEKDAKKNNDENKSYDIDDDHSDQDSGESEDSGQSESSHAKQLGDLSCQEPSQRNRQHPSTQSQPLEHAHCLTGTKQHRAAA